MEINGFGIYKMKLKFNLLDSPRLLYHWAKLTGMASFTVMENKFHPPTILSKVYTIAFAAGCFLMLPLVSTNLILRFKFKEANSMLLRNWTLLEFLFSAATVISNLFIFLVNHKKLVGILNKLCCINEEMRSLGIVKNDVQIFKNISVVVTTANACLVAAHVTTIFLERNWPTDMLIKYVIDTWSTLNSVLIFAGIMHYVAQCFESSNQKLSNLFELRSQISLHHHSRISVTSRNHREGNRTSNESLTDFQLIRKIELIHLELGDLTDQITRLFNIPIMFKIIDCFTMIITCSFWVYYVIKHLTQPRDSFAEMVSFVVNNIFCSLLRIVIVTAELFVIAHAATTICHKGSATRTVLSKVWDHLMPKKIKNELLMFSTQLLHEPISVSVFGFFNLNYSFIFEVFGSVAVYFIITIQFDSQLTIYDLNDA